MDEDERATASDTDPDRRPAGRLLRVIGLLVLAAALLYVLFFHVFPWVERNLSDPTLGTTWVPLTLGLPAG